MKANEKCGNKTRTFSENNKNRDTSSETHNTPTRLNITLVAIFFGKHVKYFIFLWKFFELFSY